MASAEHVVLQGTEYPAICADFFIKRFNTPHNVEFVDSVSVTPERRAGCNAWKHITL
jgi:hypothetical protein